MVSSVLVLTLLLHFSVCIDIQRGPENPYAETSKCELIRIPACQGLPYNTTILPNIMGHTSQEEAGQDITQYNSLVKIPCSPSLKLFLCSLYFPVCTQLHKPLPPCRSLCEQNRQRCEPIMRSFSFQWPASMQCEDFPENGLCVSEDKPETKETVEATLECPEEMRVPSSFEFRIRLNSKQVIPNCGMPCNRHFFSQSKRIKFSRLWIGLWSGLCAASTLFTILTFFIDINRFQYPERPIIFLSMCYFMVAVTYITGLSLGDKISCSGPFPPASFDSAASLTSNPLSISSSYPLLITQGTKFEGCTILFMMLYFFSMAGHIWWVVLTVTWYLAARCHWAHEAIFRNAQYLHFAAWAIPAAMTICLLAMGKVDGDPLSGVCFTGLTDPTIVRYFLIAPLCISLLLGACFLIAGFVSLFKIRTIIKTGGSKTNDLEKLIFRIGVFSLLYLLPAAVVIACYIYESQKMDRWMLTWYTNEVCRNFDLRKIAGSSKCIAQLHQILGDTEPASSTSGGDVFDKMDTPTFELFMIKYLMTLIVGITSGIWVWSSKTLHSWHVFFARICRCTPPPPQPFPASQGVQQATAAQPNRHMQNRSGFSAVKGTQQHQQALLEGGKMSMAELGGSTNWSRGQPSGAPTNAENPSGVTHPGGFNWPPPSQTMGVTISSFTSLFEYVFTSSPHIIIIRVYHYFVSPSSCQRAHTLVNNT
uniref:Frizzled n=1 Tax=Echinococcus granulosus TaxID=6210 RepID=A0A068X060_ECHGR|nr:frizzled [Echinococcus granulosus]